VISRRDGNTSGDDAQGFIADGLQPIDAFIRQEWKPYWRSVGHD
jgi:hypothetical protein